MPGQRWNKRLDSARSGLYLPPSDKYETITMPGALGAPTIGSRLLRLFAEDLSKEIQAEPTAYNYQIQISLDTEENRRRWVASKQHLVAWPAAAALAKEYNWRGYDVMGDDDQK